MWNSKCWKRWDGWIKKCSENKWIKENSERERVRSCVRRKRSERKVEGSTKKLEIEDV